MSMGLIHSIWTLLLVAIFIVGIIACSFQPPALAVVLDAAARMPEDDVQTA